MAVQSATLTLASLGFSAFDTTAVLLPLLELVADVEEPWPNIFGAGLVLLMLTSILPPILRKLQPAAPTVFLAGAVLEIADRIELLNSDPGNREPEIRAQLTRLRDLAQGYETEPNPP